MINAAAYNRGMRKHTDRTGNTTETITSRYSIQSGLSKFAVMPSGGGMAAIGPASAELMVFADNARDTFSSSSRGVLTNANYNRA